MPTKEEWQNAFAARHGEKLQKVFSSSVVAVCGLGGLGSNIATALARAGIGKLILIDYKTDRISKEEELNREALIRRMAEHHGSQLNCYAKAVEHLFGKAPDEIYVYSLPLGELIPFTP